MGCAAEKLSSTIVFFIFQVSSIYFLHSLLLAHVMVNFDGVAVKSSPELPFRFRSEDGTFKILQVADMHYGQGAISRCRDVPSSEFKFCSDLNTTVFLQRLLEAEKPDFIAFTGDNIFGSSTPDAAESLFQAFGPAVEYRIPWAAILGNHDQESTMDREELMSLISLMDYSVSEVNPVVRDPSNSGEKVFLDRIDGFGNYNLMVYGSYGSPFANHSILDLFFLDSGDRFTAKGGQTYGWIRESQLDWLRGLSQCEQDEHWRYNYLGSSCCPRKTPPALAFFHIPIPEVRNLYYREIVGEFQEAVASSSVNSGVLKTLVSLKNVKAVFIGHDHKNDFCGNLDGVWFCYGGGSGYHGYGMAGWPRRARVILAELLKTEGTWMGLERIRTWKRLDDEMLSMIDEQVLWDQGS